MRRCRAFYLWLAIPISLLVAQEPSPDAGSFEVEPPLLVQPDGRPVASAEPTPVPNRDLAQLEKQLERAKKSAASAERLYKAGVLAKLEAEQRALRVVRLQAEFANAQLALIQQQVAGNSVDAEIVQIQSTNSRQLKVALEQATATAQAAAASLAKAELDAALLNLQRQQKLLALGSGRKSDVTRAEEKLAALKSGQQ